MAQDTLNSKPSFYQGVSTKIPTDGRAAIFKRSSRESKPSRTTKAKLEFSQPANHRRPEICQMDPEVLPAAELCVRACKLQEGCPCARAKAPRQKGAQPDRRICRHQLDGVALACAGKQKQVHHRQSRTPCVSQVTTFS